MEESIWCTSCKANTAHFDLVDCTTVCERCGCVQDGSPLVSGEYGGGQRVDDATGAAAAWRLLDRSRAGRLVQQEAFKQHSAGRPQAMRRVSDISDRVQLPALYRTDVEALVDQVLQGEWGQGRWLDVLVAACAYIVIRQNRLALTIADVASAVQSSPIELGATYRRVLQLLQIQPPLADPMAFIRSAISRIDGLQGRHVSKRAAVLEQSELLLKCASRACLLTGRRPLPLIAAVLFQAGEANQVKLTLDRVCSTLGAITTTAALRLRELRVALVAEGQKLPWGADITENNVKDHLPMILQLLRFSGEAEKQEQSAVTRGGSLDGSGQSKAAGSRVLRLEAAPGSNQSLGGPVSNDPQIYTHQDAISGLKNHHLGRQNLQPGVGGKKGRGRKGGKNIQGLLERPQTPDGMASGPLGGYLQERKAREPLSKDPGSATGVAESSPGRGQPSGLSHEGPVISLPEESPRSNLLEGSGVFGGRPKVAGDNAGGGADESFAKGTINRADQVAASSGCSGELGTLGRPEQPGDVPTLPTSQAESHVHSYSKRRGKHYPDAVIDTERKSENGQRDSRMHDARIPELVSMPAGEAKPGIFDTQTRLQIVSIDGGEPLEQPGDISVLVRGSQLGVLGDSKPSTSVGWSPESEDWSALPPSFRAQAIERQGRAALIADVKQRLAGVQTQLGVEPFPGSDFGSSLGPLPKVPPRRPEQTLLTPKRKRKAVADPGWELRILEALLIRGADERLLLEGQYEQARRQLDAARPRTADEDDDVTEYIRSEAEVRLLQAAEKFVTRASKSTRRS